MFDENRLTRDDFLGMVELKLLNLPTERDGCTILSKTYPLRPRRSVRSVCSLKIKLMLIIRSTMKKLMQNSFNWKLGAFHIY